MRYTAANIKTGGCMRFSMRIRFDVLRFCLAAIPLFICTRPFAAMTANFDTAWTFTYDGGIDSKNKPVWDAFKQAVILSNGEAVCAGYTTDSIGVANLLIEKISTQGKLVQKKQYAFGRNCEAGSIYKSQNGEFIVGGVRFGQPLLLRLDSQLNLKVSVLAPTFPRPHLNTKAIDFGMGSAASAAASV